LLQRCATAVQPATGQPCVLMKRFEAEKYRQQVSDWEIRRWAEMA
jgi:hypothetical protein